MKGIGSFVVIALLVALAASTGSQFLPGDWYAGLAKPAWTPPNWAFPVAWTILYIMIAVAGWLTWRAAGLTAAIVIWATGLILNGLWSYLMFGRHDISLALIDIAGLWIAVAVFVGMAWKVDRRASYLFLPYLVWVSYAAALNFAVWKLN